MDIQEIIDFQYQEIEGLKQILSEDHYMNPEQEDELEELIAKSIKFGELCAQRDAKASVPEGFVLVAVDQITSFWQDNDEPENFCSSESDLDCLGDCIELGEIMEINKHTQAHIQKKKLFGTWFAEAVNPLEKANFFVGTHEECLEITLKNKVMIEAQEPSND